VSGYGLLLARGDIELERDLVAHQNAARLEPRSVPSRDPLGDLSTVDRR
jgi:hypothetical protein